MPRRNKTNKKPKDPNAPKKPQSSYFLFNNERRSVLSSANKGLPVTEISKIISSEWKVMDASTKQTYKDRAIEGQKKYKLARLKYEQTQHYRDFQIKLSEWKEGDIKPPPAKPKQPSTKPKQPQSMSKRQSSKRPATAFFLYAREIRAATRQQFPSHSITQIATEISKKWKALSEDEKKQYYEAGQSKEKYTKNLEETDAPIELKRKLQEWKAAKAKAAKQDSKQSDSDSDSTSGGDTDSSSSRGSSSSSGSSSTETDSESSD